MNALTTFDQPEANLPQLVAKAAAALANARTAAEVLDARELASFAYDMAKRAARMQKAKSAHDELIAAAHRAQADALEIEAQAKRRLADEYDAAQTRGEIRVRADNQHVSDENKLTTAELGLSRIQIHDARLIRDAEHAEPGIVRRTIDEQLERGQEPTKAALRKMVVDAAMRGLRSASSKRRPSNPIYDPHPAYEASAGIDGACTRIVELFDANGAQFIFSGCLDAAMLERSIAKMVRCRDVLILMLEIAHVA